jgi:hypothetical protein
MHIQNSIQSMNTFKKIVKLINKGLGEKGLDSSMKNLYSKNIMFSWVIILW